MGNLKFWKTLLSLICFVFLQVVILKGQIVINEYSASNLDDFADNYTKYEDWIELYNTSSSAVNLSGWYLSDKISKPTKWEIPEGITIDPYGYKIFWCSGRDEASPDGYHTDFKLSQTEHNEELILTNPDNTVVQNIPLQITQLGHSRCRAKDGENTWVISTSPTLKSKNDFSPQKESYLLEPTMSVEAGFYNEAIKVQILSNAINAEVYYTIDGTAPTKNDMLYVQGSLIDVDKTSVLKAIAIPLDNARFPSKICFNTYFINEEFTLPVFSVGADQIQQLANGNGELRPHGSLEYFTKEKERTATSYGELNRHGQDSWALPHRSLDWISRDEMAYSKAVNTTLFNYSDRDEYQRFMFRASGDDNYPAKDDWAHEGSCHVRDEYVHTLAQNGDMKLDVRAVERVVVFLNGDYWGVYGLRERPADHDYTEEYYDQDKYNIHYLATWGNTWAEYGGQDAFDDWAEIRDFILTNDMGKPENYDYADSRIQLKSLCDYMIANLNSVASDWLNYNTGWWRGINPKGDHKKWGYILWDNDATFDYYINYSGVPNTDPDAVACDIDEISEYMDQFFSNGDVGKHEKLFLKMLEESDDFRQLYYSRMADLLNTVYSCDNMLGTLDSLIDIIDPEMPRQIERWGGTLDEWEANVTKMRNFVLERCTLIDDGMVECYDLTGPYALTVQVEPAGVGEIELNTLELTNFPWTGEYFGDMEQLLKAKSTNPEYVFQYWESSSGFIINPDITDAEAKLFLEGIDTITAVFGIPSSIHLEDLGMEFRVYPSVVHQQFNIDLDLEAASQIDIDMVDVHGRVVQEISNSAQYFNAGAHSQTVQLSAGVYSGIYFVRFKSDDFIRTEKIIVAQ